MLPEGGEPEQARNKPRPSVDNPAPEPLAKTAYDIIDEQEQEVEE